MDRSAENGGISPRFTRKIPVAPKSQVPSGDNCEKQFTMVLQKVYQTIEHNESRLAEQERKDKLKQEWQQLALVVDRLLLLCFGIVTLTTTLSLLCPPEAARHPPQNG